MEVFILFLSIVMPLIFMGIFTFFLLIYLFNRRSENWRNAYGTSIYFIDLKNRSYKVVKTGFHQSPFYKRNKSKVWKPLTDFYQGILNNNKDHRNFRAVLDQLDKGANEASMDVLKNINSEQAILFNLRFFKNIETDYYVLIEKWQTQNLMPESQNATYNYLKTEDLIVDTHHYKGFIAFNLNPFEEKADQKIIDIVNSFSRKMGFKWVKQLAYIVNNGILIYYLKAKNRHYIQKHIYKFIKVFQEAKIGRLGKRYYNGSAIAYTKNINNRKTLQKMYATIEFLIGKSIEDNEEFVSHANKLSRDDFNSFAAAYQIFKSSLKRQKFNFSNRAVRYWKTNKKIASYAFLKLASINDRMMRRIIRNIKNKNLLIDSLSRAVGIDQKITEPVLVDIRAKWLIDNYRQLKFKKAIYVINYSQRKSITELVKIVEALKQENFLFALKIRKYNQNVLLLLDELKPQFLIISKSVQNDKNMYSSKLIINLMALSQVCQVKKIRIIYDDPPIYLDPITANKIGLKFYYK